MKPIITLLLVLFCSSAIGQLKPDRVPSYFGIQIRPLFPAKYVGDKEHTFSTTEADSIQYSSTITQRLGYSFGVTVRAGLTKLIALETGINFSQRNFDLSIDLADSNIHAKNDMSFINYDIPVNVLFYIPLSENFYMNASLGGSLTFKPTEIGVVTKPAGNNEFSSTSITNNKFGVALNANVGFEYRTKKSGFFYLGGSVQVPMAPIFNLQTTYAHEGYRNSIYGDVSGSYFAIDIKYFFPNIRNKGIQFKPGPIE
ncbi:MAG: PorT family protein [Crocinitomicaceae bacterium]|nr:PorT family protein [Crocinitomicaceae bacterium]